MVNGEWNTAEGLDLRLHIRHSPSAIHHFLISHSPFLSYRTVAKTRQSSGVTLVPRKVHVWVVVRFGFAKAGYVHLPAERSW
jgi:hypothetical protein